MPRSRLLYATAIFLSSSLLFLVEPMAGKRLLPLLGGSAAVWTTCLVFFQTTLLFGYLCAHWIATRLRPRMQVIAYGSLLAVSLVQIASNLNPSLHASTVHPIVSALWVLTTLIGLPFLVLSATNPLLQAWYSRGFAEKSDATGTATASAPPYRLFALSNFGSMLGLILYPVLIEPYSSLHVQTVAWSAGFLVFALVCGAIGLGRINIPETKAEVVTDPVAAGATPESAPSNADRVLWLLLAACGSLLLCAVTNHISKNMAAIPLLWMIPLTVYLLSFVVAFNGGKLYSRWLMLRLLPVFLGAVGWLLADIHMDVSIKIAIPFFCITLFVACLVCHGELYRLRPSPRYATSFYLLIAAGGALGAIFVGVIAPVIFRASYELAWSLVFTAVLALAVTWSLGLLCRLFWFASIAALFVVVFFQVHESNKDAIVRMRSFYGTLRVVQDNMPDNMGYTRTLTNGNIEHGTQIFTDELRHVPTTYYAHDSGVGLAMDLCCGDRPRRVGIIGLGAGTLAAYGRPGDVFRFYEIDPQVETIAANVFSYTRESKATIQIAPGDARLSLLAEEPEHFDILAVDAFSSDAIPVHLLTAQAIALYQRHLQPGGILAIHVSSLYLDLPPVVEEQAEHAGLQAILVSSADNEDVGEDKADWVLVTSNQDFLARSEVQGVGTKILRLPGLRLWTDDYSSLLPVLRLHGWKESGE